VHWDMGFYIRNFFFIFKRFILLQLFYKLHIFIHCKVSNLFNFFSCNSGWSPTLQVRLFNKDGVSKVSWPCVRSFYVCFLPTPSMVKSNRMTRWLTSFYNLFRIVLHFLAPLLGMISNLCNIFITLCEYRYMQSFTRISKAPYADSYWFLYSSKLVYYSERHIHSN
jgi:hypothetical protein